MFDWDDRDTTYVYRMRVVFLLLLFIPLLGSYSSLAYLSFIGPLIFPLGGYFYLLQYSFSLRLVYLIPVIVLAAHLVVTPLTVFLVAVLVTSCVLYVTRFWDLNLLRFLRNIKGYERYKNAKAFVRSFASRGAEGRTVIILGRALLAFFLLFAIAFLLSRVMMYNNEVRSILTLLIVFTMSLYGIDTLVVRERIASFVQQKTGNTKN